MNNRGSSHRYKLFSKQFVLFFLFISTMTIPIFVSAMNFNIKQTVSVTTWEVLNRDYPDAVFRDIVFFNSSHGWLTGRLTVSSPTDVVVLHTTDGGISWHEQFRMEEQSLRRIDVVNDQIIWVTGRGGLFYTLDGGQSWNKSIVVTTNSGIGTVEFTNETHGWTSTLGDLFKTTNGGLTWDSVPGWTFDDTPNRLVFVSLTDVWAIGWYGIYHSEDGAETWEQVYGKGGWDISVVNEDNAWAVSDSRVMHTMNGEMWSEVQVPSRSPIPVRLRSPYFADIRFLDTNNGWIVGDEIAVMYTPDGGVNWYEQSTSEEVFGRLYAVDFVNTTHGCAVGSEGFILRTIRGNTTESRLWNGLTDPVFISMLTLGVVVVVAIGVIVVCWRRKRRPILAKIDLE